jgi:lipid II isoglutaminyl synthase (glutamine-hydrolysing)
MLIRLALEVETLAPVDDQWYEALRKERIAAALQPA